MSWLLGVMLEDPPERREPTSLAECRSEDPEDRAGDCRTLSSRSLTSGREEGTGTGAEEGAGSCWEIWGCRILEKYSREACGLDLVGDLRGLSSAETALVLTQE